MHLKILLGVRGLTGTAWPGYRVRVAMIVEPTQARLALRPSGAVAAGELNSHGGGGGTCETLDRSRPTILETDGTRVIKKRQGG